MGSPATLPADFDGWDKAPDTLPSDFNKWDQPKAAAPAPEESGILDKEIPLDSYKNATLSGLQSIGRGVRDTVKGAAHTLDPRPQDGETWEGNISDTLRNPASVIGKRMMRGVGDTAKQATQVPAAIHDINQSSDPAGTYAKVGQETAGQGAGQALTALATEGASRLAPKIIETAKSVTPKQAAQTIGGTAGGIAGHGPLGTPAGIYYGAKGGGSLAEKLLGKPRANAPIFGKAPPAAESVGPIGAEENATPAAATPIGKTEVPTQAAETIKPTVAKIADQVQEGLGGKKLVPNLPLRMQAGGPGAKAAPASSIEPEHMGQFARANGYDLHKAIPETEQGDVLRAKIHDMSNVQVRQLAINAGEDMGQQAVTNAKNSGGVTRQEVLKRIMAKHSPEEIGKLIDQGKHLQ